MGYWKVGYSILHPPSSFIRRSLDEGGHPLSSSPSSAKCPVKCNYGVEFLKPVIDAVELGR